MSSALVAPMATQPSMHNGTCAPRLNIVSHLKSRYDDLREQWAASRVKMENDLKAGSQRLESLQKRRAEESLFIEQAEAKGLNTQSLVNGVKSIDEEIDVVRRQMSSLKSSLDDLKRPATGGFQAAEALARYFHCAEATRVGTLSDLYHELAIDLDCNEAGQAVAIVIAVGHDQTCKVPIKGGANRFAKSFHPKELVWIPHSPGDAGRPALSQGNHLFLAIFVESSQKFFLSRTDLAWQSEKWNFGDLAVSLPSHIDTSLRVAEGAIDLKAEYADSPLAKHLQSRVLDLTTDQRRFTPSKQTLTSESIQAAIKADWNALIKCPWNGQITQTLAALKYYAENGERPRLWCGPFEGYYGFRLRTRDHSWIMGQIFIDPWEAQSKGESPMIITSQGRTVATIGRMHLLIEANERDH